MKKETNLDFEATDDWAYEVYFSQRIWLRRLIVLSALLALLLALSIGTNVMLFPLKEKVPYLYTFDKATGAVTKLGRLKPSQISANWMLSKYFLTQYVIGREGYDSDDEYINYQKVWAQSSPDVRQQYENIMDTEKNSSPYVLYGKNKYVTVKVLAINKLNDTTVDIKFEKTLHDRASNQSSSIQKEAIVKWTYINPEANEKALLRDPLGFQVTYYQATQIN